MMQSIRRGNLDTGIGIQDKKIGRRGAKENDIGSMYHNPVLDTLFNY